MQSIGPRVQAFCAGVLAVAAAAGCSRSDGGASAGGGSRATIPLDTLAVIANETLLVVRDVAVVSDGFIVANGGSNQLLIFGRSGELTATLGREGRGPGEFQSLSGIAVRGDSLFVLDEVSRRLTLFEPRADDRRVKVFSLATPLASPERISLRDDGSLVIAYRTQLPGPFPATTVLLLDSVRIAVRDLDFPEDSAGSVFTFPGAENLFGVTSEGRRWWGIPPFSTESYYDLTDDGVVVADGRAGSISLFDWQGRSRTIVEAPRHSRAIVSDSEMAQWQRSIETRAQRMADAADYRSKARAGIEARGSEVPRPYFEEVLSDGSTIAVRTYEYGNPPQVEWLLWDTAGRERGQWVVPGNVRLIRLRRDTIVAVARDSVDLETILLLRARR